MKIFIFLCIIFVIQFSSTAYAGQFDYKKAEDFENLDNFESVEAFENYYWKYIQNCLDNTGGGTAGIPCLIESELWDRELNIQYKKLYSVLDGEGQKLLKQSQRTWMKMRDETFDTQSHLLDSVYPEEGTMFYLMRAGSVDRWAKSIIKQRALLLRDWLLSLTKHSFIKE